MTHNSFRAAAALALALAASGAMAQSAGSITVRAGVTQINPETESGDLSPVSFAGTKIDVKSASALTGGITYMLTDNIALDLPLAAGFKHDITGAGAINGVGKIGEVKALPVMLAVQWRFFDAKAALRPYIGLAPTYAKFYDTRTTASLTALTGGSPARPTKLDVESKWTVTGMVGLTYAINRRWSVEATALATPLKTKAKLSTGQTIDIKLDPLSYAVGVGYQF